ncbi:UDP-N-acetylglucosamine 2-epimerase (non-hydrolyzing) [Pedobacter polaris]|uniref:UDP-N-acetylglucosamine 2-epimerase (Non-hydrolyzing) n=1 Tax=Pedobacter polaris TaxID=2571273 RepID=A0A4U1CXC9_9SPHI|nr:UDP-N-acetylglucosamine 2-epimerase (non-hydrolyzing) [Pedobacter polaris]TKC13065.1 UDP-N-acetylglucosamine 2-epimerase (non-hydrolyzing) [Pedobacter polaris]
MKICTIIGARPQFIKAAVVSRVIEETEGVSETLIHTGQHFDANMSDVFFEELNIRKPDHQLKIGGGTHGQNTGRMIEAIEAVLIREKPDWVLVYGDTDSTLAGTLAAVKLHIPIAHVEAGLRSYNRRMPEEINRVLTDHAANLLFAPTDTAVHNLNIEGIDSAKVHQVGDVMYDATLYYRKSAKRPSSIGVIAEGFILCTIHRAENTDDLSRLTRILDGLNVIAKEHTIILPVHPRTAGVIKKMPSLQLNKNIKIIDPVGFLEMHWLLQKCSVVMTDSGGVQKEAFFHRKPCITLRDETEWVELVDAGVNILAAPGTADIVAALKSMIGLEIDEKLNLYGDGQTGKRLLEIIMVNK